MSARLDQLTTDWVKWYKANHSDSMDPQKYVEFSNRWMEGFMNLAAQMARDIAALERRSSSLIIPRSVILRQHD